ncbi:Sulfur oxidation protein SoxZ [hydrothermal vent metagenome]|uniref:Sulfur oxidation protein SoxZ n=1 Tax=hydrothermal vent metagenome TaxID=652676 RepID=A0A1W1CV62_9ZZZZ
MAKIKIKAKSKKGVIKVRALLKHPMETGLRKNKKTGKFIPTNHIVDLRITHNGREVVNADIGGSVSKNPYFAFYVPGNKGDEIGLSFNDNNGKSASASTKSK